MTSLEPAVEVTVEPVPLDLRNALPARAAHRDTLRYLGSFLIGLALHALIFFALTDFPADVPPLEEVIPVEVIIEPPPEQPAPQPETPAPEPEQAPQPNIDLKPATDAPRASNEDRSGQATKPEPAEKPQEKAAKEPDKEPPKTPDYWGLQTQLPPLEFSAPAPKSSLMRGQAERTYSSTVYAMIMEKLSLPEKREQGRMHVRVSFGIDSAGHIFQSAVIQSSGDSGLDGATLDAVRKAGTLPPPPNGGPVYLYFDLETN